MDEENNAINVILDNGYEDVVVFESPSYDTALIGVSYDNRSIYDYEKMIEWLIDNDWCKDVDEAADFISYNSSYSVPYNGFDPPIIMFRLYDENGDVIV